MPPSRGWALKPPYGKEFLAKLRARLLALIREMRQEYDSMAEEVLQPSGQESGFENPADFGSDVFTEELQAEFLEDRSGMLRDCVQALDRLDGVGDQPFGLCVPCADEPRRLCPTCSWVPPERLEHLPCAPCCAPVQEALERGRLGAAGEEDEEE